MYIFDIDGTLTHVHGEIIDNITGYTSYAYWDLLTYAFTDDEANIKEEIRLWNESMKNEADPTGSSFNMMQKAITLLKPYVNGSHLQEKAKEITEKFIEAGVIRQSAINFLKKLIESDKLCVLSTGSYTEGVIGFIDALMDKGLLPKNALDKLVISGAETNWSKRELLHANIRENKPIGIRRALEALGHIKQGQPLPPVEAVFCDDPEINDKGIYDFAPESSRFVIETIKRKENLTKLGIKLYNWETIIDSFSSPACAFLHAQTAASKMIQINNSTKENYNESNG